MQFPRSSISRFAECERGSIAIMLALVFMVLIGSAGAAVDLARGFSIQQALQGDLDAAVLSAAAASMSDPNADAGAVAQRHLDANWRAKHQSGTVTLSVSVTQSDRLAGSATVAVPTAFMGLFGVESLPISVTTEAVYSTQDVEVALVVDNTGSMAGSKLSALQSAAVDLVDVLFASERARDHVKVALVPFAQYVNVGMGNRHASWISVPPDTSVPREWCRYERPVTGTSNCRTQTYTGTNDGVPYTWQGQVCDYTYGPEAYICTPYTETQTWYGCVGSRAYPLNTRDESYDSTPVPGVLNASCPSPITPLTNATSTLRSQIQSMIATGETYVPSGLAWGWRVLSASEPYTEAVAYNARINGLKVRKILVLMTDGTNTLSPTYPRHDGNSTSTSNDLTAQLCTNIKAAGVEIFTVAFDVRDTTINDILRACATKPAQFFSANDAAQLSASFVTIAKSMSPLRIAR